MPKESPLTDNLALQMIINELRAQRDSIDELSEKVNTQNVKINSLQIKSISWGTIGGAISAGLTLCLTQLPKILKWLGGNS